MHYTVQRAQYTCIILVTGYSTSLIWFRLNGKCAMCIAVCLCMPKYSEMRISSARIAKFYGQKKLSMCFIVCHWSYQCIAESNHSEVPKIQFRHANYRPVCCQVERDRLKNICKQCLCTLRETIRTFDVCHISACYASTFNAKYKSISIKNQSNIFYV